MTAIDMFARLEEVDDRLGAAGFPRMSEFWRSTMRRWLAGKKRWLVGRVGRRGGKGLTSAKLAATFAVYCPIVDLSPGERAYVELLSVDKDEASARLGMIARALDALGIGHRCVGDEIHLTDPSRPVTIRVRAASIRAVGGTAILIVEDEVARWRDAATGANPAREIHSSIAAELLSQPHGRGLIMSAPFAENDYHAQRYDEGETAGQAVCYAPTWTANPKITEAATKAFESNPATWAREYLARPVASVTSITDKAGLATVTSKATRRPRIDGVRYYASLDAALIGDAWVATVLHRELRDGPDGTVRDVIVQDALVHLRPTFFRKLALVDTLAETILLCREYGIATIDADGHYSEAIGPPLRDAGITLRVVSMASADITARVENLQARILAGTIDLLSHDAQRAELLDAQLIAHAGGRLTLRAPERRGKHDDLVSALLLACDAEGAVKLPAGGGDIEVRYTPASFEHGRGFSGGDAIYYRRVNGREVRCEPPYGSRAFVAYAVEMVQGGAWTSSVERWAKSLGLEPKPGLDARLLDPKWAELIKRGGY